MYILSTRPGDNDILISITELVKYLIVWYGIPHRKLQAVFD